MNIKITYSGQSSLRMVYIRLMANFVRELNIGTYNNVCRIWPYAIGILNLWLERN